MEPSASRAERPTEFTGSRYGLTRLNRRRRRSIPVIVMLLPWSIALSAAPLPY
jgi:hypothetical protein